MYAIVVFVRCCFLSGLISLALFAHWRSADGGAHVPCSVGASTQWSWRACSNSHGQDEGGCNGSIRISEGWPHDVMTLHFDWIVTMLLLQCSPITWMLYYSMMKFTIDVTINKQKLDGSLQTWMSHVKCSKYTVSMMSIKFQINNWATFTTIMHTSNNTMDSISVHRCLSLSICPIKVIVDPVYYPITELISLPAVSIVSDNCRPGLCSTGAEDDAKK